eukprot:TRINITY_DN32991_c0_g1_i1.p1 TRINITY_DN32991_c0_g1~~TRINITY_DN32991_c0_g1_i1.p1  ORF type:complete len:439 (+),score=80.48 TRINITY_DN32991_c0_g1_i1:94-1410(+)
MASEASDDAVREGLLSALGELRSRVHHTPGAHTSTPRRTPRSGSRRRYTSPGPTRYTGQRVPQHVSTRVDGALARLCRARSQSASPTGGGSAHSIYPEDGFPASPVRARRLLFAPDTSHESPRRDVLMPLEGTRWRPERQSPYAGYPGDGCVTPHAPVRPHTALAAVIAQSPPRRAGDAPELMALPSTVAGGLVSVALRGGWTTCRLVLVARFLLDRGVQLITVRIRGLLESVMSSKEADALIQHTTAFTSSAVFCYGHLMGAPFWEKVGVPSVLVACREPAELRDHTLRFDHHMCLDRDGATLHPLSERQGLPSARKCQGHTVHGVVFNLAPQAVLVAAQHLPGHVLASHDVYISKSYVQRRALVFTPAARTGGLVPDVGYLRLLTDTCGVHLPSRYLAYLHRIMADDTRAEPSWKTRHKALALALPFPSPSRARLI